MLKQGIYLSLLTALISGFSVFANKIFVSTQDPLVFIPIRNLLVAGILGSLLVFNGTHKQIRKLKKHDVLKLIGIGIVGGGLPFAMFFVGLKMIGAVEANLIHKTMFIWVAVMALPFLKEKLNAQQIAGYIMLLAGIFWLQRPTMQVNPGMLLVGGATFFWAIEQIIAKKILAGVSYQLVGFFRMGVGVVVLFLIAIFMKKGALFLDISSFQILPLVTSSLFLTAYVLTWYKALSRAPATVVSAILVLAPLVTWGITTISSQKPILAADFIQNTLFLVGFLFVVSRIRLSQTSKSSV